jgi:carboxymethylenebutenolidase
MDQRIQELYDDYRSRRIGRRDFLGKLAVLAGSVVAADWIFDLLENKGVRAEMIPADDARLTAEMIDYQGETGPVAAYFSRPKGNEKLPGVVVIHENRGLNAHIKDVTRRVALEGFLALAPDALSPKGGTPPVQEQAIAMIGELDPKTTRGNFLAAVEYLANMPESTGKVGVMGFCWGGGMSNQLAVNSPELAAAVPYYGMPPDTKDVPKIKASLLLHYAGDDERINKGIPEYEAALKKAGVEYELYTYDGAQHAFNNDTNGERYNPEAAKLAWERTLTFLKAKLKT